MLKSATNTSSLLLSGVHSLFSYPSCFYTNFRKRIGVYSFKIGKLNKFKNPHAMPLYQRNLYKAQGYKGEIKMRELMRNGDRPFGRLTSKGKFMFDVEKVPFYNVPDLAGFKVPSIYFT